MKGIFVIWCLNKKNELNALQKPQTLIYWWTLDSSGSHVELQQNIKNTND